MWWGKEDDEMYHMDGRPANDSARRAAGHHVCRPCAPAEKSFSRSPSGGLKQRPVDCFEGIDLMRTSFSAKVHYDSVEVPAQLTEGLCLVCALPEDSFRTAAIVSTGHPDELFIGFKLGRVSPDGGHYGLSVLAAGGHFRVYTLVYDKKTEWFIGNECLPIAGPDGIVTTGVFPDDFFRAIGRVISLPTEQDPYLGITGFAHT